MSPTSLIVFGSVGFTLVIGALAALVALFVKDPDRRKTAYQVLRLVLLGGAVTLVVRLHEAGLLS